MRRGPVLKTTGLLAAGLLSIGGLLGYHWNVELTAPRPLNHPQEFYEALEAGVRGGDVGAYYELRTAYLDEVPGSFLYWAVLMATRHRYAPAYDDANYALAAPEQGGPQPWLGMSTPTRQQLRRDLRQAAARGEAPAADLLRQLAAIDARVAGSQR
jgi:hypothetical protein